MKTKARKKLDRPHAYKSDDGRRDPECVCGRDYYHAIHHQDNKLQAFADTARLAKAADDERQRVAQWPWAWADLVLGGAK